MNDASSSEQRCPVCHRGTLVDIAYDRSLTDAPDGQQSADSHQLETFTCGHRVAGASLASADQDRLDVEQRDSEDTVDPLPDDLGKE